MPADGWKRTKDDDNILMNSETRFAANQTSTLLPAGKIDDQILPSPMKQVVKAGPRSTSPPSSSMPLTCRAIAPRP